MPVPVPGMVGKKVVQYHDNRMCMEGEGEGDRWQYTTSTQARTHTNTFLPCRSSHREQTRAAQYVMGQQGEPEERGLHSWPLLINLSCIAYPGYWNAKAMVK